MTLVIDKLRTLLPGRAKQSPSGWTSFNAPCCHHRGHKPDRRKRAGVRFDTGFVYNCFNCKFTASWQPGRGISERLKKLCFWLGADDDDIKQLTFEALKTEQPDYVPNPLQERIDFEKRYLPEGTLSIDEWLDFDLDLNLETALAYVIEYLVNRGFNPTSGDFFWCPLEGLENRVIIPFKYIGDIVGYTARKVTTGGPKYLSNHPPQFIFNVDKVTKEQKYVIVCEGPFDALSIGGVAVLTNDISEKQIRILNNLGKEIIIVPDQDLPGANLIERAVENKWSVSFPNWDPDIKDINDAVNKYGKLFVLVDIMSTSEHNPIKIEIAKKNFLQKVRDDR